MLSLELFDYNLPEELIAQKPLPERDQAKMLVISKNSEEIIHSYFYELPKFLKKGDIIVVNKSRVVKARIFAYARDTGGKLEILFTELVSDKVFKALVSSRKKAKVGRKFLLGSEDEVEILGYDEDRAIIKINSETKLFDLFEKYGEVPLPHYIRRKPEKEDEYYYQTIFAEKGFSVAAPTAGLHFTERVIKELEEKGIEILPVMLHVGPGTFKPVKVSDVTQHKMDYEYYEIPEETAKKLESAKKEGRRIIACGTTSVRTLETWKFDNSKLSGKTDLFIYPGFQFTVIDGMITNFHLPKSTPLILVCAFAGREKILRAYESAILNRYRFLSYGDAMLILP